MNELSGLWTAEFGSVIGISGGGVVIFQGDRILGGDGGYYYEGSFQKDGAKMTAKVVARPFNRNYSSVFSTLGEQLNLDLTGQIGDREILVQGALATNPNMRIGIKLTKRV
jgi:T3SS negative regulator,GrlR